MEFDIAPARFVKIPLLSHFSVASFVVRFESIDSILPILVGLDIMGSHGLLAWG